MRNWPFLLSICVLFTALSGCGQKREIVISFSTPQPTETSIPAVAAKEETPQVAEPTVLVPTPTPTAQPERPLPPGESVEMQAEGVQISAEWKTYANGNQAYRLEWDAQGRLVQVGSSGLSYTDIAAGTKEVLTRDDGLPSTTLRAYAESANGEKWIATRYGGLGHWNGVAWQRYTTSQGLPHNSVRDLLVDRSGTVWVATVAGLMTIRNGQFQVYTFANGLLPSANTLWSLYEDSQGNIWVGTNGDILRWDGAEWTLFGLEYGVAPQRVREFTEAADGAIWAASENTALRFDGETWASMRTFASGAVVQTVFAASDGRVWVGLLNPPTVANEDLSYFADNAWTTPTTAPVRGILSISENVNGDLYIGTIAHGTWRFDGEQWIRLAGDDELLGGSIYELALAPDGGHIVSSDSGEIAKLANDSLQSLQPTDGFLISRERRPIVVMPDGEIWIGSLNAGLFHFDGETWGNDTVDTGLISNRIDALAVTEEGQLWIANGSALTIRPDDVWQHAYFENNFLNDRFADIAVAPDGSTYGYGRTILKIKDGEAESIQYDIGNVGPQFNCGCSHIAFTDDGQTWVSNGSQITRFEPNNLVIKWNIDRGLPDSWINSIDAGPNNTLWVSTGSQGVFVLQDGQAVANFNSADGLASDTVYQTKFDADGTAWFATHSGVSRLSSLPDFEPIAKQSGNWELFTDASNAVDFVLDGDEIWAATGGGILHWTSLNDAPTRFTTLDGLDSNRMIQVEVCEDMVLATSETGTFQYEPETGKWLPFNPLNSPDNAFRHNFVVCYPEGQEQDVLLAGNGVVDIYADGKWSALQLSIPGRIARVSQAAANNAMGSIWLVADRNIIRVYEGNGVGLLPEQVAWLESENISSLAVEADDTLWVGTSSGVLGRWRDDGWMLFSAETHPNFPLNKIDSISIMPDGQLLLQDFATHYQFNTNSEAIVEVQLPPDYPIGLHKLEFVGDTIFAVSKSFAGGVSYFDGTGWSTIAAPSSPNLGRIQEIIEDKWGNVWVLGANNYRLTPEGQWEPINRETAGLNLRAINAVSTDDGVWFGADPLVFFDGENFTEHPIIEDDDSSLNPSAIAADDAGRVWVATQKGIAVREDLAFTFVTDESTFPTGVQRLVPDGERMWVGLFYSLAAIDELEVSEFIYEDPTLNTGALTKMPDGNLLLGQNGTLTIFDPETDLIRPIPELFDSAQSVYAGDDGTLWVGTDGSGVFYFDGESWLRLNQNDGLPDRKITSVFVDSQNRVWFGSPSGLSIYTP